MGVDAAVKKKFEPDSDLTGGNVAHLRVHYGRRVTYAEYLGLWLNRDRELDRRAHSVERGVSVADGKLDPGLGYWRAVADGEGEALFLKGLHEAARG